MPALFTLDVEIKEERDVVLRLSDEHGTWLASNEVSLANARYRPSQLEGIFDTRGHVRRIAGNERELAASLLDDHWSGHGHHNMLEIAVGEGEAGGDGKPARPWITGAELVGIFKDRAGALSPCSSS